MLDALLRIGRFCSAMTILSSRKTASAAILPKFLAGRRIKQRKSAKKRGFNRRRELNLFGKFGRFRRETQAWDGANEHWFANLIGGANIKCIINFLLYFKRKARFVALRLSYKIPKMRVNLINPWNLASPIYFLTALIFTISHFLLAFTSPKFILIFCFIIKISYSNILYSFLNS